MSSNQEDGWPEHQSQLVVDAATATRKKKGRKQGPSLEASFAKFNPYRNMSVTGIWFWIIVVHMLKWYDLRQTHIQNFVRGFRCFNWAMEFAIAMVKFWPTPPIELTENRWLRRKYAHLFAAVALAGCFWMVSATMVIYEMSLSTTWVSVRIMVSLMTR